MEDREQKIIDNMPLVNMVINKYFSNKFHLMSLEDMRGYGYIGLIKAVDNFDESRGFKFSTYGVQSIWSNIRNAIRDKIGQIGSRETKQKMQGEIPAPFSYYEQIINKDNEKDITFDIPIENFEDSIIDKLSIDKFVNKLDTKKKKVFELYYLEDKKQDDIGEIIGVSQVQVSRILSKVKKELMNEFSNRI